MSARESFRIDGVGCWCPGEMTLTQLRILGHTASCSEARRGWRANYAHLSALDRERRIDAEVGRQVREAAASACAAAGPEGTET